MDALTSVQRTRGIWSRHAKAASARLLAFFAVGLLCKNIVLNDSIFCIEKILSFVAHIQLSCSVPLFIVIFF